MTAAQVPPVQPASDTPTSSAESEREEAAAWDYRLWFDELMRLVDLYWQASAAGHAKPRAAIRQHAATVGMHWRSRAALSSEGAASPGACRAIQHAISRVRDALDSGNDLGLDLS